MEQYCVNCGNKLREGAAFCSNCGRRVTSDFNTAYNAHTVHTAPVAPVAPIVNVAPVTNAAPAHDTGDWDIFGKFLSGFCLVIVKLILYLIMGGFFFAFVASGGIALSLGGVMLYNFAVSGSYALPSVLSSAVGIESLSGAPLIFSGISLIFTALLLVALTIAVIRSVYNSRKKYEKTENS